MNPYRTICLSGYHFGSIDVCTFINLYCLFIQRYTKCQERVYYIFEVAYEFCIVLSMNSIFIDFRYLFIILIYTRTLVIVFIVEGVTSQQRRSSLPIYVFRVNNVPHYSSNTCIKVTSRVLPFFPISFVF